VIKFLLTVFLGFIETFYTPHLGVLEQIQHSGKLRVATRIGPTTYYVTENGPVGLEYELMSRFARQLGVELEIIVPDIPSQILTLVSTNQVHFAAAGLTINDSRKRYVRFGSDYQKVSVTLVYHGEFEQAQTPEDLLIDNTCLLVASNNDYLFPLNHLKTLYPQLTWQRSKQYRVDELLAQVDEQLIDFTVAQSHELAHYQRVWPDLKAGFELTDEQPIAWMFPRFSKDDSLYLAAFQFFSQLQRSGELRLLLDQYYGHMAEFNYTNTKAFHLHIEERLPRYINTFKMMGNKFNIDWRLLAAIGYQESRWDSDAVSHTGVRGIMQLTEDTAKRMNIHDRSDPEQSILGGSKYFHLLYKILPKSIQEPDRTWMALAAYNQGIGHLHDARRLTDRYGSNPNHWVEVKQYLRKLSDPAWFSQTKHGYTRGFEALRYVQKVREFYDILVYEFPASVSPVEVNTPHEQPLPSQAP